MELLAAVQIAQLHPVLAPVLIFFARIIDVSLGTLRIMLVARGMRLISSCLGFCEVLIWLLAISQIVLNLGSLQNYIAYAAGFAAGTYVGMTIERKLSLGTQIIRVIIPKEKAALIVHLIANDYRVTHVDAEGALGPVKIIFTIVRRSDLQHAISIIRSFDPNAFYTVEDIRLASESGLPKSNPGIWPGVLQPSYWLRKSK